MFVCFFNDFFNEQRLQAGMFLKVMILDTSALSTKQLMFEMQEGTKFTLSFLQHSYLSSGFILFSSENIHSENHWVEMEPVLVNT